MRVRNVNLTEYNAKLAVLRAAIDEGDASGLAEGDVFEDIRQALSLPPSITDSVQQ